MIARLCSSGSDLRMRPKRSLGQNFLIDPNLQRKIVDALDPAPDDAVVEIGPGRGALTEHLADRVRRLVAIELDDRLASNLQRRYRDSPSVQIVQGDALELEQSDVELDASPVKVIGNIPYNITTPLLFRFLQGPWNPVLLVLMVQREVADRILAPAGRKAYGALSIGVRMEAEVERLFHVGRKAFRPEPDVDSTVLRIRPRREARLSGRERDDLRTLTRAAFGQRRKQFQKILRTTPPYHLEHGDIRRLEERTGVRLTRRPETFTPEQFVELANAIRFLSDPDNAPSPKSDGEGAP